MLTVDKLFLEIIKFIEDVDFGFITLRKKQPYFRKLTEYYLAFLVPRRSRILAFGYGHSEVLERLNTVKGVYVNLTPPNLAFPIESSSDINYISGSLAELDLQTILSNYEIHRFYTATQRV